MVYNKPAEPRGYLQLRRDWKWKKKNLCNNEELVGNGSDVPSFCFRVLVPNVLFIIYNFRTDRFPAQSLKKLFVLHSSHVIISPCGKAVGVEDHENWDTHRDNLIEQELNSADYRISFHQRFVQLQLHKSINVHPHKLFHVHYNGNNFTS